MAISKTSWSRGVSGNPKGRARKGRTITDLLEKKLDKERFVNDLIRLARGGKDIDKPAQLSAMKLILGYIDGLPVSRAEIDSGDGGIRIEVNYVQNNRVEFTGAARGTGEGDIGGAAFQRGGMRPPLGEDGAGFGQADSSGTAGKASRLVRAQLPAPE